MSAAAAVGLEAPLADLPFKQSGCTTLVPPRIHTSIESFRDTVLLTLCWTFIVEPCPTLISFRKARVGAPARFHDGYQGQFPLDAFARETLKSLYFFH